MKKIFLLPLLAGGLFFSSCEKSDGSVTFYVSNAGTAKRWDHIAVTIGGQTKAFFTPEAKNMSLGRCEDSGNSATFTLSPGTYPYSADNGSWKGTVSVEKGSCSMVVLSY